MNLDGFLLISEVEQDEEILDHGIFIGTYQRDNLMVDIYRLYDFYVTMCYDPSINDRGEITASATISFPDGDGARDVA
ncbi:MAG: hypothetical protein ABIN89_25650 [Chitinophagaceae bacterium]